MYFGRMLSVGAIRCPRDIPPPQNRNPLGPISREICGPGGPIPLVIWGLGGPRTLVIWGPFSDLGPQPLNSNEKLSTRQQCASQTRFWKHFQTIFCFHMPMRYLFFSPCICLHVQDSSCRSLNIFAFDLGPPGSHIMHL